MTEADIAAAMQAAGICALNIAETRDGDWQVSTRRRREVRALLHAPSFAAAPQVARPGGRAYHRRPEWIPSETDWILEHTNGGLTISAQVGPNVREFGDTPQEALDRAVSSFSVPLLVDLLGDL